MDAGSEAMRNTMLVQECQFKGGKRKRMRGIAFDCHS